MKNTLSKYDSMIHPLGIDEVHIWKVKIERSELFYECKSILSDLELKKADFFKFSKDSNQYIISLGTLRILLSNYLGISPLKVKLGRHSKGKPYSLDDRSLFFNMSNSGGLCVFAFSRDSEIGVDIEKKRNLSDLQDLIKKNFTSSEIKFITQDQNKKLERFFRFWTIKEAYLKAIGEGMRLTPDNLEFSIERNKIKLVSRKGMFEYEDWILKEFQPSDDFMGTIVYQNAKCNITEKWYSNYKNN